VLADISGIPDFFSQAAPFIRSLLPADRFPGSRLPRLKWSAKAVFLSYLTVTIPLLGFFVYLMVRFLPRIATSIWDAVVTQAALFGEAHGSADVIGMATAAAEIAILALASTGTAYFLYILAWKPLVFAWRQPTLPRRSAGLAAVAGVLAAIGYFWAPQLPFSSEAPPAGVQTFAVSDRTHVTTHVDYAQSPPVGGPHAPVWQNCGFYDRPVRPENAVHSLEHGAVWITYRRSLAADQISALRKLADSESYVLVSPYTGLPAPLVASAWGRQLRLTSVRDARLERFVHAFRHKGPERGGLCSGGRGKPL
jgi:hypothetical protein